MRSPSSAPLALLASLALAGLALAGCGKNESGGGAAGSGLSGAKHELARVAVRRLAEEAYAQWAMRPANAGRCPTAEELGEYTNDRHPRDPWGAAYVIRCTDLPPGAVGIAVSSNGPDGTPGTDDDVASWR